MSCIICLLSNNDFFISSNICLIENEVLSNCTNLVIKVITVGTNVLNAVDIPCIATNPIPKLAIYSPNADSCYPCGACRQVMQEFQGDDEVEVITEYMGELDIKKLSEFLPFGFKI